MTEYAPEHLRPVCYMLKRPELTTWTILHDVSDTLERHDRPDQAQAFRKEGLELQAKQLHPMDEVQEMLELACLYVDFV